MVAEKSSRRARIVIVGGGFAGLAAARELGKHQLVTLIDSSRKFEFLPNIHELVSLSRKASSLRTSRRRIVEGSSHRFVEGRVMEIDPVKRFLRLVGGKRYDYDILIAATGGQVAERGVTGIFDHALPLRSVAQAERIGERLEALDDSGGRCDISIVGGGFIGVECLGEILRRYRQNDDLRINVIEPGERLLGRQPEALHEAIERIVRGRNVELLTGRRVAALEEGQVLLDSGDRLRSDLTIWAAGIGPAPVLVQSGLAEPDAWAAVRDTLQSRQHHDVFVAGDGAGLETPLGKQSYHATDMGKLAARNAQRLIDGEPLEEFEPQTEQFLITFGFLATFYVRGELLVESAPLGAFRELLFEAGMAEIEWPVGGARSPANALERLADYALSRAPFEAARTLFPLPFPFPGLPRDRYDLPFPPRLL